MVLNARMIGWARSANEAPTASTGARLLERAGHTATIVGKDIYVIGGLNRYVRSHCATREPFTAQRLLRVEIMHCAPCRQTVCEGVCKLDTASAKWSTGFLRPPFGQKKFHTATLVGSDIWVLGGSDLKTMSSDVYVLNTKTLQWRTVKLRLAA